MHMRELKTNQSEGRPFALVCYTCQSLSWTTDVRDPMMAAEMMQNNQSKNKAKQNFFSPRMLKSTSYLP